LTLESLAENRRFSLFQGIAHEIAHFWWNFGSGQGDWINESFAEYFSAVALEIISAKEEFESALKMYRRKVGDLPADAPSLSIVPFLNDRIGYIVRYYKGALMLDDLRCLLGDDAFFKTCRDFYQEYGKKSIGTPEFRSFWKNRLGHRGRGIDIWLDSKGDCRGSIDSPGPR
ncbi:MAG: M1 family aminopeptidase, partial [Candidatus Aminicenantes bacterium]|nr:M1 family aminopeptidase [Candidatus Aminicenantes bacterium]